MRASVLNRRNRILNFRLTDKEFEELRAAFSTRGGPSLSDFARAAVLSYAHLPSSTQDALDQRLDNLDEKLTALDGSVRAVLARLGRPSPSSEN